ncbi:acyl-CoA dehydrogenase family protein [Mycobacterium sp. 3519A]|uniref:acyl-CoA dehydrogenase family protein n=1 Tax=Mycobacterium sp. 3519A TaxID=2057184 RepID=UPI000C7BBF4C|nr:acyl-CoA dehydrogenase family protein [Mycobacterium sp. 3519A]
MTTDSASSLGDIADAAIELAHLRESADGILGHAWSIGRLRALLEQSEPAFDDQLWRTVRELGWPDVLVSESSGGGGGTLRELAVLAEAAGAAAAPVPLTATAAAAWCLDSCEDGVTLILDRSVSSVGQRVSGFAPVVPYGASATRLLVLAESDECPVLGVVDPAASGVSRELLRPLDHNPAAAVTFADAQLVPIAEGNDAVRRHSDAVLRHRIAAIAELVGIASAANAAATEYAKVRVAFGRPIGSYQAIKHRLVDQRSAIEVARALINRAADACEQNEPDSSALVSLAAFWAIDALRAVPEGATQVFGGIAYTWEHDAHIHLRRAATAVATLGSRAEHRRAVTDWLTARHASQR